MHRCAGDVLTLAAGTIGDMALPSTRVLEANEDVTVLDDTELEEPSEDEDIDGPSMLLDQETNEGAEVDLVVETDKVFDTYIVG